MEITLNVKCEELARAINLFAFSIDGLTKAIIEDGLRRIEPKTPETKRRKKAEAPVEEQPEKETMSPGLNLAELEKFIQPVVQDAAAEIPAVQSEITFESLRGGVMGILSRNGKGAKVKEIIESTGVSKLSEVDPIFYPKIYQDSLDALALFEIPIEGV